MVSWLHAQSDFAECMTPRSQNLKQNLKHLVGLIGAEQCGV